MKAINLDIIAKFRKLFPELDIKEPRWATLGITDEFRELGIGEVVLFPVNKYNFQTVRATPATSMINERMNEGREWKVKLDKGNKSIAVLRLS